MLCLLVALALSARGEPEARPAFLSADEVNASWHVKTESGRAVFVGEASRGVVISLRKDALADRGMEVSIETDAPQCMIAAGDVVFLVPVASGGSKLLLLGGQAPSLAVDGQAPAEAHEKWKQIATGEEANVRLRFQKATFASLTFRRMEANEARITAAPGAGAGAVSLEAAKKAVFQIQVRDESGKVYASGSGFLAGENGIGITNLHVVQGASGAVAIVSGVDKPVSLELLDARAELDLAVVKLAEAPAGVAPLAVEEKTQADEAVHALGYARDATSKGALKGAMALGQLPERMQKVLAGFSKDSQWVQTDCAVSRAASGGPVINARGAVVGVSTWLGKGEGGACFALSAKHVAALLREPNQSAVGFGAVKERHKFSTWALMPDAAPSIASKRTGSPEQIVSSSAAVAKGIKRDCISCAGKGEVTVKVQSGTEQQGPLVYPTYRSEVRKCVTCDGTGVARATPDVLQRLTNTLVSAIANARTNDAAFPDKLRRAYIALSETICPDKQARALLISRARSTLAQPKLREGTPLLTFGLLVGSGPVPEAEERVYFVSTADNTQLLMVTQPALTEELSGDDKVLVGGLYAGSAKNEADRAVFVLQGGLIIRDAGPREP